MLVIQKRSVKRLLWQTGLLIFFCVAFHADWRANGLLWWGSVGLLCLGYAYKNNWKIAIRFSWYDTWWIGFIALALLSSLYAFRPDVVLESVKTFLVMLVVTYFIGKNAESGNNCEESLYILLLSLFIVSIYIFLTVDLNALILTRIGQADTGRWNVNSIGMMTSFGILLAVHFFKVHPGIGNRLFMLAMSALFIYLNIITASRKAFFILIIGFCLDILLSNPKKTVRNILLVLLILCLSYLAATQISWLYNLIGWRIDGMIAAVTGSSSADTSSVARLAMLSSAWDCFLENPILGCGMDNFRFFNSVRETYAHNNFAEIAADLGIVGIAAYYWIFIGIIFDYFKNKRRNRIHTLLFVFVMLYLIVHYAVVTTTDILQNIIICLYIASAGHLPDGSVYSDAFSNQAESK